MSHVRGSMSAVQCPKPVPRSDAETGISEADRVRHLGPRTSDLGLALLCLMVFLLAACGGSGTGDSDGSLSGTVNETRARYQILDLATGRMTASGAITDLASNPEYRTTKLAFRLVDLPAGMVGSASNALGAALDPSAATTNAGTFYLAVFETTQAQWQLIAGSTPWVQLSSSDGSDDVRIGDHYPAIGLSQDLVDTVTQAYRSSSGVRLGLPSDVQWELACRAGGSGTWSWGSLADSTTVTAQAVVWETAGTTRGARTVGGRTPNPLGLYDVHGNVWELTAQGHLRGGSWNDPLATARCAHRADLDPATRHLLVGARLVYIP